MLNLQNAKRTYVNLRKHNKFMEYKKSDTKSFTILIFFPIVSLMFHKQAYNIHTNTYAEESIDYINLTFECSNCVSYMLNKVEYSFSDFFFIQFLKKFTQTTYKSYIYFSYIFQQREKILFVRFFFLN